MEYAIWKGIRLSAHEVAKSVEKDAEVRSVSSRDLFCPDPECKNPILRYCNGEIKRPYFAHICNTNCDYEEYDKTNSAEIKDVCKTVFDHFTLMGYDVRMEEKILKHHYTNILITTEQGNAIAVEFGDKTTKKQYIDKISEQYKKIGVFVRWIFVGKLEIPLRHERLDCLKEYSLSKAKNKDLIIIDPETKFVGQYKFDKNPYIIADREVRLENYLNTYEQKGMVSNLTIENEEVTIKRYYINFDEWIITKNKKFKEKKEKEENRIEQQRIEVEKERQERQKHKRYTVSQISNQTRFIKNKEEQPIKSKKKSYEERKQEFLPKMNQITEIVYDSSGIRWLKCEKCGKIDEEMKFLDYGGANRASRGVCSECCRKSK